jgi:hemerythrin-like domain-containing protein
MKALLAADHLELDFLLDELFAAFEKDAAAEVYQKLDFFWARLAMHIRAENLHLFPSILKAAQSAEANDLKAAPEFIRESIRQLENDHNFFMRELGGAIKQLFELRENNWRDEGGKLKELREKMTALRERLKSHNELEESDVYSWAETLAPAEVPDLRSKIKKELENLPPRFRKPD